ncbi:MAG: hypothetical protein ACREDP_20960 [Bradyrhizobium sp.]
MLQDSLMAGLSRGVTLMIRVQPPLPQNWPPAEQPRRPWRRIGLAVVQLGQRLVALGERLAGPGEQPSARPC